MFHSATCVDAMPPSMLRVGFADGEIRDFDVSVMTSVDSAFDELLADESLFREAHLSPGGYGIVWSEGLDLSVETVYEDGRSVPASSSGARPSSDAAHRSQ